MKRESTATVIRSGAVAAGLLTALGLGLGAPTLLAPAIAAQDTITHSVELPLIPGWYKGQQIYYLQTEASDPGLAKSQQATYVARLSNAITANPPAVDDIYAVTNFTQSNVVPSAPLPEGPNNTDPNYTPLWQVSLVTWIDPRQAHVLTSEEDVLAAANQRLVTINKTNIVVNCSIIYSPQGGLFPQARIIVHHAKDAE